MFCPNCGANIPDKSVICSSCGSQILIRAAGPSAVSPDEPKADHRTDRWYLKLIAGLLGVAALIIMYAAPLINFGEYSAVYFSTITGFSANNFFGVLLFHSAAICLLIGLILSLCLKKVPGLFIASFVLLVISALLIVGAIQGSLSVAYGSVGFGYIGSILLCVGAMILEFFSFPAYTRYRVR